MSRATGKIILFLSCCGNFCHIRSNHPTDCYFSICFDQFCTQRNHFKLFLQPQPFMHKVSSRKSTFYFQSLDGIEFRALQSGCVMMGDGRSSMVKLEMLKLKSHCTAAWMDNRCSFQALFLDAFLVGLRTLLHASTMSQRIPDIHGYSQIFPVSEGMPF